MEGDESLVRLFFFPSEVWVCTLNNKIFVSSKFVRKRVLTLRHLKQKRQILGIWHKNETTGTWNTYFPFLIHEWHKPVPTGWVLIHRGGGTTEVWDSYRLVRGIWLSCYKSFKTRNVTSLLILPTVPYTSGRIKHDNVPILLTSCQYLKFSSVGSCVSLQVWSELATRIPTGGLGGKK